MRQATHAMAALCGLYAGLSALELGYHELLQGNVHPESYLVTAVGTPCEPEEVWHACEPALTVLPSFVMTGIFAMTLGVLTMLWAAGYVHRHGGGPVLMLLSLWLLLFGGGIIPPLIGMTGGTLGHWIQTPVKRRTCLLWGLFARLWPWPLVLSGVWLFGQPLIGGIVGPSLPDNAAVLLRLLVLSILVAYGHDTRKLQQSSRKRKPVAHSSQQVYNH